MSFDFIAVFIVEMISRRQCHISVLWDPRLFDARLYHCSDLQSTHWELAVGRFLSNLQLAVWVWRFPIFTFNLGFKICWNILYNNPVQSNFFLAPGCFLHTAVAPTLFDVTGLPRMSEAHYWIFPPLVNLQWSGLTDNVSFTLTPMARWGQVKLASNYSVVPFNEQQY